MEASRVKNKNPMSREKESDWGDPKKDGREKSKETRVAKGLEEQTEKTPKAKTLLKDEG